MEKMQNSSKIAQNSPKPKNIGRKRSVSPGNKENKNPTKPS